MFFVKSSEFFFGVVDCVYMICCLLVVEWMKDGLIVFKVITYERFMRTRIVCVRCVVVFVRYVFDIYRFDYCYVIYDFIE